MTTAETSNDNDILARARAALAGTTDGPWGTDGDLIASDLTQPARGITEYKYGIARMCDDDYDEEDGPGEYDGEVYRPYEQMLADAKFIAESRVLIEELADEVELLRRGGKTLGEIVEKQCRMALDATGLHHLIDENGDGDWGAVWENLAELGAKYR